MFSCYLHICIELINKMSVALVDLLSSLKHMLFIGYFSNKFVMLFNDTLSV